MVPGARASPGGGAPWTSTSEGRDVKGPSVASPRWGWAEARGQVLRPARTHSRCRRGAARRDPAGQGLWHLRLPENPGLVWEGLGWRGAGSGCGSRSGPRVPGQMGSNRLRPQRPGSPVVGEGLWAKSPP